MTGARRGIRSLAGRCGAPASAARASSPAAGIAGRAWVALAAALLALVPAPLAAQVNAESFARLGFNFNPPGARATAMGGAFIPIADDATAAEANPAGLTALLNPQFSFEFKGIRYTRTLLPEAGGAGIDGSQFVDERGFPSFASVVVPTRRVTLGVFRHELVNYLSTLVSNGAAQNRLLPFTSKLDLKVQNVGAALAVGVGENISVGVAAGASILDLAVDFPRYGASRFEPSFMLNRLAVDERANGIFVNAGIMWRPDDVVSMGAVYKRRPAFDGIPYALQDANGAEIRAIDGELRVPDSFGGGISVRATELLTLSLDGIVNRYSQLARNQAVAYQGEEIAADDYRADDGTDIHFGVEYILLLGETPVSLRAGASRLAPSNVYYVGLNRVERDLWGTRPADAQTQLSGGVGLVLLRRLQLEVAGVTGDDREEFVASLVWFLGER